MIMEKPIWKDSSSSTCPVLQKTRFHNKYFMKILIFQVTGGIQAAFSEKFDTYFDIDHESFVWLIVNGLLKVICLLISNPFQYWQSWIRQQKKEKRKSETLNIPCFLEERVTMWAIMKYLRTISKVSVKFLKVLESQIILRRIFFSLSPLSLSTDWVPLINWI